MSRLTYGTIMLILHALLYGAGGLSVFCIWNHPASPSKANACYEKPFKIFFKEPRNGKD